MRCSSNTIITNVLVFTLAGPLHYNSIPGTPAGALPHRASPFSCAFYSTKDSLGAFLA
jgi:hypothetical protein